MFETIKKNWALLKKVVEARQEIASRLWYKPVFKNVQGVEVFVDNAMLHQFGFSYAAALVMTDGSQRIYVDTDFFNFPTHVQLFVLQHEKGHIELGHLDGPLAKSMTARRRYLNFWGSLVGEEMEADKYAYEKVGTVKALSAMDYLRHHMDNKANAKEMNRRYNLVRTYPFASPEVRENKLCSSCGKEMPLTICPDCTDRYFDETLAWGNELIQNFVKGEK